MKTWFKFYCSVIAGIVFSAALLVLDAKISEEPQTQTQEQAND